MSGMDTPEWTDDLREKMFDLHKEVDLESASLRPKNLQVIENFSTHFAEFEIKDKDLLLHLFPRAGSSDTWAEGRYLNRCRNCRKEVPIPKTRMELKACSGCGHMGLVYIPGRQEEKATCAFPGDMKDFISKALDNMWLGDAATEYIPELGAYVVQFQGAASTATVVGELKFVDRFCGELDFLLDGVSSEH